MVTLSCDTLTTTPRKTGCSGHENKKHMTTSARKAKQMTTTPRKTGGSGHCVTRQSDNYLEMGHRALPLWSHRTSSEKLLGGSGHFFGSLGVPGRCQMGPPSGASLFGLALRCARRTSFFQTKTVLERTWGFHAKSVQQRLRFPMLSPSFEPASPTESTCLHGLPSSAYLLIFETK